MAAASHFMPHLWVTLRYKISIVGLRSAVAVDKGFFALDPECRFHFAAGQNLPKAINCLLLYEMGSQMDLVIMLCAYSFGLLLQIPRCLKHSGFVCFVSLGRASDRDVVSLSSFGGGGEKSLLRQFLTKVIKN